MAGAMDELEHRIMVQALIQSLGSDGKKDGMAELRAMLEARRAGAPE